MGEASMGLLMATMWLVVIMFGLFPAPHLLWDLARAVPAHQAQRDTSMPVRPCSGLALAQSRPILKMGGGSWGEGCEIWGVAVS